MGLEPIRANRTEDARALEPREASLLLERGHLLHYPVAPFALPEGEDRDFLLAQRLADFGSKNVSYDPITGSLRGLRPRSESCRTRLADLLNRHSQAVRRWLAQAFPHYAAAAQLDRVSFRPEEEATRRLRTSARNDLLHFDAFPNRPARGRRILRVFANINPTEPRVWLTAEDFATVYRRYGASAGLDVHHFGDWLSRVRLGLQSALHAPSAAPSRTDLCLRRFHDFLKRHDEFQERSRKRLWKFGSGAAWMLFSDGCSHAELRGRFALEHSFFIAPAGLLLPHEAPAHFLEPESIRPPQSRAA